MMDDDFGYQNVSDLEDRGDFIEYDEGYEHSNANNEKSSKNQLSYDQRFKIIDIHILNLINALGGFDYYLANQDAQVTQYDNHINQYYKIGSNCFIVLKDIKKWIRFDNDYSNDSIVPISCHNHGLVQNGILNILNQFNNQLNDPDSHKIGQKINDKIAIISLEILVNLTWPINLASINNVKNYFTLKRILVSYKSLILSFNDKINEHQNGNQFNNNTADQSNSILKSILKISLPIISTQKYKRSLKDYQVLNLSILLIRNLLIINPISISNKLNNNKLDTDNNNDISLNHLILTFHQNKIFDFLLLIFNSLKFDLANKNIILNSLEIIYYLTKDIDPKYLFDFNNNNDNNNNNNSIDNSEANHGDININTNLLGLLNRENFLVNNIKKNSSSRHSKFGSQLQIRSNNSNLTVFGQSFLLRNKNLLDSFSLSKKTSKNNYLKNSINKNENDNSNDGSIINNNQENFNEMLNNKGNNISNNLTKKGKAVFKNFVSSFVENSLNSFISSVLPYIQEITSTNSYNNNNDPALNFIKIQYNLTCSWFLEFETHRQWLDKNNNNHNDDNNEDVDLEANQFGYIANYLSDQNLKTLINILQSNIDKRNINSIYSSLITFNGILVLIQKMDLLNKTTDSNKNERSFFYFTKIIDNCQFHEKFYEVLKIASTKSFSFISITCQIIVNLLLLFEKNPIYLKKLKKKRSKIIDDDEFDNEEINNSDKKQNFTVYSLDFNDFINKIINEKIVGLFIKYFSRFEILNSEQLIIIEKFFSIIFFKISNNELYYKRLLFRLDLIHEFYEFFNQINELNVQIEVKNKFKLFFQYYMKELIKNLKQSPSLYVELLFSNINKVSSIYYPESLVKISNTNRDVFSKKIVKPIEFIDSKMTKDNKLEILIKLLKERERLKSDGVTVWLIRQLDVINDDKFEKEFPIVEESNTITKNLIKNAYLRLLIEIIGIRINDKKILGFNNDDDGEQNKKYFELIVDKMIFKESYYLVKKYYNEEYANEEKIDLKAIFKKINRYNKNDNSEIDKELYDQYSADKDFIVSDKSEEGDSDYEALERMNRSDKKRRKMNNEKNNNIARRKRKKIIKDNKKDIKSHFKSLEFIEDSDGDLDKEEEFFAMEREIRRQNGILFANTINKEKSGEAETFIEPEEEKEKEIKEISKENKENKENRTKYKNRSN
ncbi:Tof1p ASCRUDRAFT_130975 [Ascoidea rubescens DSM 1968]|uniref:Topoisomerase 1-associated factor 1 n=1 Tax=Ascoidea rubescens DSM 1968 TaxID=1344418 RepID=A0A1D2V8Z3_9ASCO|nr:hypothetical protein ASCRUDRAFT_130975 [Ascoidea rubescens DSM 1968]ODV57975.1 hypothetical protein ASCRUDRAFT_130975 [Ascoidea rubescens DSM 1968]